MPAEKKTVSCPRCGTKQTDRGPTAIYFCDKCRAQFDNDPDEGGTYSDRDPSARLERQERKGGRGPGLDRQHHRRARGTYGR